MTLSELPAFPLHRVTTAGYRIRLATDPADVVDAQRLRFSVFDTECGAITPGPAGRDVDRFDEMCDHLIVCHDQPAHSGTQVVATCRLLPPHANDYQPRRAGLYSSRQFDLTPLEPILDRTVEAGRSCVAAHHRHVAPMSLLWGGITGYLVMTGYRYLLGCASIPLDDGGGHAAAFDDLAWTKYAAPQHLRCRPAIPFHVGGIKRPAVPAIPSLLNGYLRLGAVICGPPSLDVDFGTADFLTLVDLATADPRYLRFFAAHAPDDLLDRT